MKDEHVPVVIQELYESDRVPHLLSNRTGAEVVTLVSSVGAIPAVPDYLSLFDYNVHVLATALGRTKA
jgi:ABC-type Zn uptake system ZnuABC Zn-binding protein ZnuA